MDRVYSNMCGDESSSSHTAILPWSYLQRPIKCPLELSWWCQIFLYTHKDKGNPLLHSDQQNKNKDI
jgi:hypothetical protein